MNDTFSIAEISSMLATIPAPPPYQEWMRICSAVWSVLPMAEGCQVLQAWSPEKVEGEYATKHKARLQKVGIGTLVHLAQQNGWTGAPGKRRHPGKVLVASAPMRTGRNSRPACLFPSAEAASTVKNVLNCEHSPKTESQARPLIPGDYCPTCWSRWSRALRPGFCYCTGAVKPLPSSIRGVTKATQDL
jgi:hypothetical protein